MRAYRCYLMNRAGLIAATELIECAGDGDAQQVALKLFREERQHYAVEVWDQARQIFRQTRDAA
jgi:hypothetical protein